MADPLFPRPRRDGRWYRATVPVHAHRHLNWVLGGMLAVFAAGWTVGIVEAASAGTSLTGSLTRSPLAAGGPPEAAFVLDALVRRFSDVEALRGRSGALNVVIPDPGETLPLPDSVPGDVAVELTPAPGGRVDSLEAEAGGAVPLQDPDTLGGGVWALSLRSGGRVRTVPNLRVLTQVPLSEKRGDRIGRYMVGSWPFESGGTPPSEAYETPRGVVRVGQEDVDLPVSKHFTLGDFLTKGQEDVWPKYVVLSTRLLDKLELTIQELERMGHPVEKVGDISGFRTPHYNVGGGNPSGRGSLSRHMYGDAMDFYIDNDGNGCMDDLTGDGQANVRDARVLAEAANRVEKKYPDLVGGIGTYSPTGAHCGFVHVDTRGYRARW